jgi:hypothetical protein
LAKQVGRTTIFLFFSLFLFLLSNSLFPKLTPSLYFPLSYLQTTSTNTFLLPYSITLTLLHYSVFLFHIWFVFLLEGLQESIQLLVVLYTRFGIVCFAYTSYGTPEHEKNTQINRLFLLFKSLLVLFLTLSFSGVIVKTGQINDIFSLHWLLPGNFLSSFPVLLFHKRPYRIMKSTHNTLG